MICKVCEEGKFYMKNGEVLCTTCDEDSEMNKHPISVATTNREVLLLLQENLKKIGIKMIRSPFIMTYFFSIILLLPIIMVIDMDLIIFFIAIFSWMPLGKLQIQNRLKKAFIYGLICLSQYMISFILWILLYLSGPF